MIWTASCRARVASDLARTLCSADRCSLFLLDHAKQELEAYLDDRCTVRTMPLPKGRPSLGS